MRLARNSKGQPSVSLTMLWLSFITAMILSILSVVEFTQPLFGLIKIKPIDSSVLLALLGIPSGLYGWRRSSEAKEIQDTLDKLEK